MSRSKRLSDKEAAEALNLSASMNHVSATTGTWKPTPEQRLERIEACANVSGDQDMGDTDWLLRIARAAVARNAHLRVLLSGNDTRASENIIRDGRDTDQAIMDAVEGSDD